MRRVIAHLIRGAAKEFHEGMTKDLAAKFDSFPLHERIPPHLTLKRWFELGDEDMKSLHAKLDVFAATHHQSDYHFGGLNHFDTNVIYIDVKPSQQVLSTVRDLMATLHSIESMTFDEFDGEEDDLHATLALQALKPFDYERIWQYLHSLELPEFDLKFDNIALLKKGESKWEIERVWEFT